MTHQKGDVAIEMLIFMLIILMMVAGWFSNIISLAHADFSHDTGMCVLRVVGIFLAPIGAVLGYF